MNCAGARNRSGLSFAWNVLFAGVFACAALSGCVLTKPTGDTASSSFPLQESQGANPSYITVEADANGTVAIDPSLIGAKATFINYQTDEGMVQMVGVRLSDDSVRVALNTCQSCSPAPKAFFVQDGDVLVCQNCGQEFAFDIVGSEGEGCNPIALSTARMVGSTIVIDAAELETLSSLFESWVGPVEPESD